MLQGGNVSWASSQMCISHVALQSLNLIECCILFWFLQSMYSARRQYMYIAKQAVVAAPQLYFAIWYAVLSMFGFFGDNL